MGSGDEGMLICRRRSSLRIDSKLILGGGVIRSVDQWGRLKVVKNSIHGQRTGKSSLGEMKAPPSLLTPYDCLQRPLLVTAKDCLLLTTQSPTPKNYSHTPKTHFHNFGLKVAFGWVTNSDCYENVHFCYSPDPPGDVV